MCRLLRLINKVVNSQPNISKQTGEIETYQYVELRHGTKSVVLKK